MVLTSPFGAIRAAHPSLERPFDETDWSNLTDDVWSYRKSKTLSGRAAWDFIAKERDELELSVINPTAVPGPVTGQTIRTPHG